MWAACPTAIDIAGDTVYLLPRSATSVTAAAAAAAAAAQAQASPEAVRALFERFVRGRTLLTLTATNPAGRELDAVENQVRNEEMRKRLAAWSTNRAAGTPAGVLRSFSWDARTGGWFEPGFAVEVDDADGRSELLRLGREFGQLAVYEYAYDTGHAGLLRTVVKCDAPDAPAEDPPALVGPVARPGERHPIYAFEDWYHLYHRASTVVAFFRRWFELDSGLAESAAAKALEPFLGQVSRWASATGRAAAGPPLVVVEGLDGSGKSTLVHAVAARLRARQGNTPPPSMTPLRKGGLARLQLGQAFDDQPEAVRRAFYGLCNYVFADEIAAESATTPIIVDRFWASTESCVHLHAAAYAIARAVERVDDVPPAGDTVYHWPEDLPKPRAVLFLDVPAQIRSERIAGRGQGFTPEEILLKFGLGGSSWLRTAGAVSGLASRVAVAYRHLMGALGPDIAVTLDASQPAEALADAAMAALQARGIVAAP